MFNYSVPLKLIYKLILLVSMLIPMSDNCNAQKIADLARSGTVEQMEKYLKKHPDQLNCLTDHGASPFLLAAYNGNNLVALLLMEKGADLNQCYPEGSILYALVYKNNLVLLDSVLSKGVNVNDTCNFAQFGYPLHLALSLHRYEIVERFMEHSADLKVIDQQGRTIDQLLAIYNDPKYVEIFKRYEK